MTPPLTPGPWTDYDGTVDFSLLGLSVPPYLSTHYDTSRWVGNFELAQSFGGPHPYDDPAAISCAWSHARREEQSGFSWWSATGGVSWGGGPGLCPSMRSPYDSDGNGTGLAAGCIYVPEPPLLGAGSDIEWFVYYCWLGVRDPIDAANADLVNIAFDDWPSYAEYYEWEQPSGVVETYRVAIECTSMNMPVTWYAVPFETVSLGEFGYGWSDAAQNTKWFIGADPGSLPAGATVLGTTSSVGTFVFEVPADVLDAGIANLATLGLTYWPVFLFAVPAGAAEMPAVSVGSLSSVNLVSSFQVSDLIATVQPPRYRFFFRERPDLDGQFRGARQTFDI